MSTTFQLIPPRVPFVGPDGVISREWYQFLLNLFKQVGGGGASTMTQDQFEAMFVASYRPPMPTALENTLREVATALQTQRSERAAITALSKRIDELEQRILAMRQPPDDRRIADLQTITFGSRPWL